MAEPIHIPLGILPGDIHNGAVSASPPLIVRPVTAATALLHACIPFVKGNFEFADREGGRDGDAVLGFGSLLGGWRAHGELTGRDHNHRWTISAVLEFGNRTRHPPNRGRRGETLLRRQSIK